MESKIPYICIYMYIYIYVYMLVHENKINIGQFILEVMVYFIVMTPYNIIDYMGGLYRILYIRVRIEKVHEKMI